MLKQIAVPVFFTPNGYNDYWNVKGMQQIHSLYFQ
jgi:hypothetical protein